MAWLVPCMIGGPWLRCRVMTRNKTTFARVVIVEFRMLNNLSTINSKMCLVKIDITFMTESRRWGENEGSSLVLQGFWMEKFFRVIHIHHIIYNGIHPLRIKYNLLEVGSPPLRTLHYVQIAYFNFLILPYKFYTFIR